MKNFNLKASISLRAFIFYIVFAPFVIGLVYISGFKSLFYFFISLFFYFIIYFPFSFLWRRYIKKEDFDFLEILKSFLLKVSIIIFISFVAIWSFAYYYNNVKKASLPLYVLTNGEKTVEFQTMSHIASPKFYEKVKYNIINAKQRGFVLFYEGVKIGSKKEENKEEKVKELLLQKYNKDYEKQKKLLEEFNKALGIKFDKDLYKKLSLLYGLVPQDNSKFLNLVNNKDFNVDLDLEEVMKLYKEKVKNKTENKNLEKIQDVGKEITDKLAKLNKRELKILRWINKAIMNYIISNTDISNLIFDLTGKQDIFSVILHERNKNLAKEIQNSKYKKIFVIYGKMHFKGTFEELRKMDKRWRIINKIDFYPIK